MKRHNAKKLLKVIARDLGRQETGEQEPMLLTGTVIYCRRDTGPLRKNMYFELSGLLL